MSATKPSETIPNEWLARTGLAGFTPTAEAYRTGKSEHPDLPLPVLVRLDEIRPPRRSAGVPGLVADRAMSILGAIAADTPLPPVMVYAAPDDPYLYRLGAGFHRFTISRALGFQAIPAAVLHYWEPWMTGDPMP